MARKAIITKTFDELLEDRYGDLYKNTDEDLKVQKFLPTGSLSVDASTGRGGFPKGKVTMLFGRESTGKTHLTLHFCKNCIVNEKLNVLYEDAELGIDLELVEQFFEGIDYTVEGNVQDFKIVVGDNHLRILKVRTFEQALDLMQVAARTDQYQVVVLDSISAISPKEELEKSIEESTMAKQSQGLNKLFRTTMFDMMSNQVTCIFISQSREKFGAYIPTDIPTGGNGIKHFASLILHVKAATATAVKDYVNSSEKPTMADESGNPLYKYSEVTFDKNKVGKPYRTCLFPIIYGKGIDEIRDLLLFSSYFNIVEKRGSWYIFNETRLGQGQSAAMQYLKENPEICKEIRNKTLELLSSKPIDKSE